MKFANATKPNRKSGVAKWRDLQFLSPSTNAGLRSPTIAVDLPPGLTYASARL